MIDGEKVRQSEHVKLLGVQISNKSNFDMHVKELCQNINQELCAFSRMRRFLNRKETKTLLSIFMSNFSYCPLIWMFCSNSADKEIKKANKRALRVLNEDYDTSYEELFGEDGSITVHQKYLRSLMTEV